MKKILRVIIFVGALMLVITGCSTQKSMEDTILKEEEKM